MGDLSTADDAIVRAGPTRKPKWRCYHLTAAQESASRGVAVPLGCSVFVKTDCAATGSLFATAALCLQPRLQAQDAVPRPCALRGAHIWRKYAAFCVACAVSKIQRVEDGWLFPLRRRTQSRRQHLRLLHVLFGRWPILCGNCLGPSLRSNAKLSAQLPVESLKR